MEREGKRGPRFGILHHPRLASISPYPHNLKLRIRIADWSHELPDAAPRRGCCGSGGGGEEPPPSSFLRPANISNCEAAKLVIVRLTWHRLLGSHTQSKDPLELCYVQLTLRPMAQKLYIFSAVTCGIAGLLYAQAQTAIVPINFTNYFFPGLNGALCDGKSDDRAPLMRSSKRFTTLAATL